MTYVKKLSVHKNFLNFCQCKDISVFECFLACFHKHVFKFEKLFIKF